MKASTNNTTTNNRFSASVYFKTGDGLRGRNLYHGDSEAELDAAVARARSNKNFEYVDLYDYSTNPMTNTIVR
jgi:hypothetical protein